MKHKLSTKSKYVNWNLYKEEFLILAMFTFFDISYVQVPFLPKVTNIGLHTSIGLQESVFKFWFTNFGSQILVYKFWFTNFGLQILVYYSWNFKYF
jgi:hypothetical protein